MKNNAAIKRQLEEIKKMDDWHAALTALADIQYDIGMDACSERKDLRDEIEVLRKVIIGNGDPTNSIVTRITDVEKCMGTIGEDIKEIKDALLGDLKTGKKGLMDRVSDNEKVNANMVKVVWIIVGVAITQVIATLLGLL